MHRTRDNGLHDAMPHSHPKLNGLRRVSFHPLFPLFRRIPAIHFLTASQNDPTSFEMLFTRPLFPSLAYNMQDVARSMVSLEQCTQISSPIPRSFDPSLSIEFHPPY